MADFSEQMRWAIYVVAKLAAYTAWCFLGVRLLRRSPWPMGTPMLISLVLGFVRLVLGIMFGVAIFILTFGMLKGTLFEYVVIYTPVRAFEWAIVAALLLFREFDRRRLRDMRFWLWASGGILVSFAVDTLSPLEPKDHFCVGRCLC